MDPATERGLAIALTGILAGRAIEGSSILQILQLIGVDVLTQTAANLMTLPNPV